MKPADVVRELAFPLTSATVFLAMLFFWLVIGLGRTASLFGIALLVVTVPAYLRYLLYLLEARANGRQLPVPDIAMFNPADNLWTFTPFIFVALGMWAELVLAPQGMTTPALVLDLVLLAFVPASLAILAITHSPSESLNPAAIARMIRACGVGYVAIPVVLLAIRLIFELLVQLGAPSAFLSLGTSYQTILIFSLTGAVLRANNLVVQVDIPEAQAPTADEMACDLDKERRNVVTHAYGFVSRGNRDGGLAHIRSWIEKEADVDGACRWFFNEMLTWESKDAALLFAQTWLSHMLYHEQEAAALKLLTQCLHENARFRPLAEDRDTIIELAERHGRDDIVRQLRS